MKTISRNSLQAEQWCIAPRKVDLQYLGHLTQIQTLTLQNAYHFYLPSTSLINLTSLHLLNSHLPCLQHLFQSSPIKNLSIINKTLPVPIRSLTILLVSVSKTLVELSLCTPRYQNDLNVIREIIYDLLPDLQILRTTPSFLFSNSGSIVEQIHLPKRLEVLEILDDLWFDELGRGRGGVVGDEEEVELIKKHKRVGRLVREMERLRELEVRREWNSEEVGNVCAERGVELFVR